MRSHKYPPAIDSFMVAIGFKSGEYDMSQVGYALFFWYMFDLARLVIFGAIVYLLLKFFHII